MVSNELFDERRQMPDPDADREFKQLVGLDRLKTVLLKQARLVLVPRSSRTMEQGKTTGMSCHA